MPPPPFSRYLKMLAHFRPTSFFRDFHMPNMLVFHPTVNFHKHQLETSGKIALQDKVNIFFIFFEKIFLHVSFLVVFLYRGHYV